MKISTWLWAARGSGCRPSARRHQRLPHRPMELLEQRIVPATTQFVSGTLTITAQNNEALGVTVSGANVFVNGTDSAVVASVVATLVVNGDAGANNINLSAVNETSFPALTDVQIVAGQGADTIVGSAFDDVITWNNGDGSDTIDGGVGQDRLVVNASNSGDDVFALTGANGRFSLARQSLINFTLNTATVEDLVINLLDGNDSVTVGNTATSGLDNVTVLGGNGNDTLNMTGINLEALRLLTIDGQAGDDTVVAGAGSDGANGGADAFHAVLVETPTGFELELSVNGTTLFASPDQTSQVQIVGSSDADTLTLETIRSEDESLAPIPSGGINFNGAGGNDALALTGPNEFVAYSFTGATAGRVEVDLNTVNFSNVETIDDQSDALARAFFFGASADVVTVTDSGTATDQVIQVALSGGTTTRLQQAAQGGSLSINVGGGNDALNLTSLDNNFAGDLLIDGDAGNDTVTVGSLSNVASALEVNIDGGAGNDILNGSQSSKTIIGYGGTGDDSLQGGSANDSLFGEDGNDTFSGGAGNDQIRGAAGDDSLNETGNFDYTLTAERLLGNGTDNIRVDRATITGGAGDNIIDATAFNGPVVLIGGAGNDELIGSAFADTLRGDTGDDTLSGLASIDILRGEAGNDSLIGGTGNDNLQGGTGNDEFLWQNGDNSDAVSGSSGNDVLTVIGSLTAGDVFTLGANGTQGRFQRTNLVAFTLDLIFVDAIVVEGDGGDDSFTVNGLAGVSSLADITFGGGLGNDTLNATTSILPVFAFGDAGNDSLTGGSANDQLDGGEGDDQLNGGDANDALIGGTGNDSVTGGNGNDILSGGLGNDTIAGNAGTDRLVEEGDVNFTLSNAQLRGGLGIDNISDIETAQLTGGAGANIINASTFDGATTLIGLAGNDTITGGNSDDSIRGGDGNDSVLGGLGNDLINGGNGDDSIYGGEGNDGLSGFAGNDLLVGNAGNDSIVGGLGNDTLLGGAGADICLGKEGADIINGQGSTDTLAGGAGTGANSGDGFISALASEIDEFFQFSTLPAWIDQA